MPASLTPVKADASSDMALRSSTSRLWTLDLPQALASSETSMVIAVRNRATRSDAAGMSTRFSSSGSCVATPTGHRPVWQCHQPSRADHHRISTQCETFGDVRTGADPTCRNQ